MSSSSQFGPSAPAPQKSGGGSVLMIILIVCGVLLLLCAGICGGCVYVTQSAVKSGAAWVELMPVMTAAMGAAQADQQVLDKLGEPIEVSAVPTRTGTGELNTVNEDFQFELKGPKGSAKVKGSATKEAGTWKVTAISVQTSDGATFTVEPPAPTGDVQFEMPDMPEETK
jgi:cytochrome oxidase complex assembly protein 1